MIVALSHNVLNMIRLSHLYRTILVSTHHHETTMRLLLIALALLPLQDILVAAFMVGSKDLLLLCKGEAARERRVAENDVRSHFFCRQKMKMSSKVLSAKRRGKLGSLVEEGLIDTSDVRKRKAPNSKAIKKNAATNVSPDLASYMASKPQESSLSERTKQEFSDQTLNDKKKSSSRRVRTTERMRLEEESSNEVKTIVADLQKAITKGKEVIAAVNEAKEKLSKVNKLKQLVKSTTAMDYRLAWVESDAAVCAVGSALHRKISLARLQEVFLTLHRNRLQMYEVVRILGPFPNVKNTLSGSAKFSRKDRSTEWTINWQSLIDGTGKENYEVGQTKSVTLDILHGDEQIILATVIDDDIPEGQNRLVFVREEDMDTTLESLRVL